MALRGNMSIEKWVFRGKMGVFELEKNRTSNQSRKAKWVLNAGFVLKNRQGEERERLKMVVICLLFSLFLR